MTDHAPDGMATDEEIDGRKQIEILRRHQRPGHKYIIGVDDMFPADDECIRLMNQRGSELGMDGRLIWALLARLDAETKRREEVEARLASIKSLLEAGRTARNLLDAMCRGNRLQYPKVKHDPHCVVCQCVQMYDDALLSDDATVAKIKEALSGAV